MDLQQLSLSTLLCSLEKDLQDTFRNLNTVAKKET